MKLKRINPIIGKDITNFVCGTISPTNKGYWRCLGEGVVDDNFTNIFTGYLDNDGYFILVSRCSFSDRNSATWTTVNGDVYYDNGNIDIPTRRLPDKYYSNASDISRVLSNTNSNDYKEILEYGGEIKEVNEFITWYEQYYFTQSFTSGLGNVWSEDDNGYTGNISDYYKSVFIASSLPTATRGTYYITLPYLYWYTQVKGYSLNNSIIEDNTDINKKFITEWTLFVDGVDSGNPIFSWKWASNSFDNNKISQEESVITIEYGTYWNREEGNPPPKLITLSWDSQPFTLTLEDIYALTNSKPSVTDGYFAQAQKRKIFFTLHSICGEYESDGISALLWESGRLYNDFNYPDGVVLYGEDTFRYLEGQPPQDDDNGDNTDDNGGGSGYENPNNGNPTGNVQGGTTYFITPVTFNAIKQWLWNADFLDNIKLINNNPIENIVSVKYFPFSRSGTNSPITLGNVNTGYSGDMIANNVYASMSSPYVTVPRYYNNFLDYSPYTNIKIHLPFVGIKELDTNIVMGKSLECRYIIDCVLGQIEWDILINGGVMYSYTGSCGMDIPISGQNRSEVEMGYITSAVTTGVSLISGNVVGGVLGILNGASQQYKTETSGNYAPSLQMFSNYDIYLIIERPTITIPSNYGHTNGYPYNKGEYIKNVSGYTICENVDIKGFNATEEEKTEIKAILESGFYA